MLPVIRWRQIWEEFEMQKDCDSSRPNQQAPGADHKAAKGFRPLALPAVVAAVKAIARRPAPSAPVRREQPERDES